MLFRSYAVVTRARDAVTKLRTATPWVRRAEVSGLELAITGDASWELGIENDFKMFSGTPERVDAMKRAWPGPRIELQYVVRDRTFDCDKLRRALLTNEMMKEIEHRDWPSEFIWVVELAAEQADGTGILRAQTACARTATSTLMVMAQMDHDGSYAEVLRALVRALGGSAAAEDVDRGGDDVVLTERGVQMGRVYAQGFRLRGDGADDRYGARVGLDLWADLDTEATLSRMFAFGLSGSANNELQLGFDLWLAFGGVLKAGPVGLAVLATGGVDRVTPVDGVGLYAGAQAALSVRFGAASLSSALQLNTSETRGFVQVTLRSALAFGAEWIRYRDAMTPTDMIGLFVGVAPP